MSAAHRDRDDTAAAATQAAGSATSEESDQENPDNRFSASFATVPGFRMHGLGSTTAGSLTHERAQMQMDEMRHHAVRMVAQVDQWQQTLVREEKVRLEEQRHLLKQQQDQARDLDWTRFKATVLARSDDEIKNAFHTLVQRTPAKQITKETMQKEVSATYRKGLLQMLEEAESHQQDIML